MSEPENVIGNRRLPFGIILAGIIVLGAFAVFGTPGIPGIATTDPNNQNECFFGNAIQGNSSCYHQVAIPAVTGTANSTLCTKISTNQCSPIVVNIAGLNVFTGEWVFVVFFSSTTATPVATVTDNVGNTYLGFTTVLPFRIYETPGTGSGGPYGASLPTTITTTFTAVNSIQYGVFIYAVSGVSELPTAVGGNGGASVTTQTVADTPIGSNSLFLTGQAVTSGSCHDPFTETSIDAAPTILGTVNIGCTNGNREFTFGDAVPLNPTLQTFHNTFAWINNGQAFAFMLEVFGNTAFTLQLYSDSEVQTSTTVLSGGALIRQAGTSLVYNNVEVEAEGYVTITALSATQTLTFTLGTCPSTLQIKTNNAIQSVNIPFTITCVQFNVSGGVPVGLSYTATSTDAQSSIVISRIRAYGLL